MDQKKINFVCQGLEVGRCYVPPFEARAGELVKLKIPRQCAAELDLLRDLLSKPSHHGSIRATGQVCRIDFPAPRSAWRELFHRQQMIEWFSAQTGLSSSEAAPLLSPIDYPMSTPFSYLAGTPRKLLSLQVAIAQRPDVLIFDTVALDPLGVQAVLRSVIRQLGDAAAICLDSINDEVDASVPFAAEIDVQFRETEVVSH